MFFLLDVFIASYLLLLYSLYSLYLIHIGKKNIHLKVEGHSKFNINILVLCSVCLRLANFFIKVTWV